MQPSSVNRRNEKIFRRKLLILPRFQLILIALNAAVISLVFGAIWIQTRQIFLEMSPLAGLSGAGHDFFANYLNYHAQNFQTALIVSYAVAMITSSLATLIVSYRFAGPLVRLQGYFRSIANGRNERIFPLKFRTGDFFSDLPPVINQAIARIQNENLPQEEADDLDVAS